MQSLVLRGVLVLLVRAKSCWKEGHAVRRKIASGIEENVAGLCCHRQCSQTSSCMALFLLVHHHHAAIVPWFTSNKNRCFSGSKARESGTNVLFSNHISCDDCEVWRLSCTLVSEYLPRRYVLRLTGLEHLQLFDAKLLFKVGAQLCQATLQWKVEVGSTLFFE